MSFLDLYLQYTTSQESPRLFHQWCAVSIIASVLNRRVWLDRRSAEGVVYFTDYPGQLSICLVAGAGRCKKSTAVNIAKPLMKEAGVGIFAGKITPEGLLDELGSRPKPVLTIVASELSVFLSKANYNDGLVDNLNKLIDCEENDYKTKGRLITLKSPCLTILMATTPSNLGKAIPPSAQEHGFLSRHIFVYSEQPGAPQPLSFNEDDIDDRVRQGAVELRKQLISQLHSFSRLAGGFSWSRTGQQWFNNYYDAYRNSPASEGEGYPQRRPNHLVRVAMCLQVAYDGSLVLTDRALIRADQMLNAIEPDMPKAFAFIGQHINSEQQERIIRVFKEEAFRTGNKHPAIGGKDLVYKTAKFIPFNELQQQLQALIAAGVIANMGKHPDPKRTDLMYSLLREPY